LSANSTSADGRALARGYSRPVDDSISGFVRRLNLSQWLLLLYPAFMWAVARRRHEDDLAVVDGSAMAQIGMTAVCGLWAAYRWTGSAALRRTLGKSPWRFMAAYCLLAVASGLWSDLASFTLFRGGQIAVFLVLVADAVTRSGSVQACARYQLCFAAAVALFGQYMNLLYGLSIDAMHSSAIPGSIIGAVFAGWLAGAGPWRRFAAFIVVTMLLGTSLAAVLAALVGLAVLVISLRGRYAQVGWFLLLAAVGLGYAFSERLFVAATAGKDEKLIESGTGRVPVWQWALEEQVPQHPWLGFGYGYGDAAARLFNRGLRMMHMHNAVLSALMNLGVCGLAILVLLWAAVYSQALRIKEPLVRAVLLGAVTAVIVNSMAMESVSSLLSTAWIGHLLLFGTVAVAGRRADAETRGRLNTEN
jgi:hypothetical protein